MNKQRGFTIIEVVLVLAIAGLIFLIVFLALPQLQKNRRDTQRKNDAGIIIAALNSYASNNMGNFPLPSSTTQMADFTTNYLDAKMKDPSKGVAYSFISVTPSTFGQVQYARNAACNGSTLVTGSGSTREIAVLMRLENGSYCRST